MGVLLAVCQALENTTVALSAGPPRAAAVRSHFDDCPDAHSDYCFHGTCRFLVQKAEPSCVCHSGFVGRRCEHADLLAVVAASQKKQTITALVVVSVIASVVLIVVCVLIHCCRIRKHCEGCRTFICRHEKPNGLLKGGTSCCHSETDSGIYEGLPWRPNSMLGSAVVALHASRPPGASVQCFAAKNMGAALMDGDKGPSRAALCANPA
ncbi:hypothetical protein lerEdw1_010089 [Lerista edwardsae]|nr:hypothetical protein lerEdw1_010089 [Lerista edwardsae]